jgi:hypothetical protein
MRTRTVWGPAVRARRRYPGWRPARSGRGGRATHLLRSALGDERVLSDAYVALLAATTWTSGHCRSVRFRGRPVCGRRGDRRRPTTAGFRTPAARACPSAVDAQDCGASAWPQRQWPVDSRYRTWGGNHLAAMPPLPPGVPMPTDCASGERSRERRGAQQHRRTATCAGRTLRIFDFRLGLHDPSRRVRWGLSASITRHGRRLSVPGWRST